MNYTLRVRWKLAASQAKRVSPEFNSHGAMSINIKKLIEQVKQRPPLWDRQHCGYFNKKLVAKLWSEIALSQGVDRAMPNCCVVNCKNSYSRSKSPKTSYFHFPRRDKSPKRYGQWVKKIGRRDFVPSRFSSVCELHFRKEDLDESQQLKMRFLPQYKTFPKLKKTAVPTLRLNPESISNVSEKVVKERKSVYLRKKLVQEAIDELEESESIIKAKWKGLRDTFRLELKKPYQESTWSFFNQMMFLRDHMKSRLPPLKLSDGQTLGLQIGIKEEPQNEFEPENEFIQYDGEEASGSASFDQVSQDEPSMDEPPDENFLQHQYGEPSMDSDTEKDDDYHFLMSFLPEMKKLDIKKKMLLRIKMLELFYKETYDPDYS